MTVNTGGGAGVNGDVGTEGGEFTGRDGQRISISLANNEHLLILREQVSRMEDTINWRLTTLDKEVLEIKHKALENAGPTWFQFILITAIMAIVSFVFYGMLIYGTFVALRSLMGT